MALTHLRSNRNLLALAKRVCGTCSAPHSTPDAPPMTADAPPMTAVAPRTSGGFSSRREFSTTSSCRFEFPRSKGLNGLKFKEQRDAKRLYEYKGRFILPLPDYQKARAIRDAESYRAGLQKLKRDGMLPPKTFRERPIDITSSGGIQEPYVPPEGDGSKSLISKEGAQQKKDRAQMWTKSKNAFRKLNKIEKEIGGFNSSYFAEEAVDLYILAHEALANDDRTRLHELVTSKCYQELKQGLRYKTLRWRFHHNVESPRAVHGSLFELGPQGNQFAQVTIRIHSQQSVAIYDRFGRLAYGDPDLQRSVLEYIVFEKRVSDTYGAWRMHGKLEPDWLDAPKPPIRKTFRIPDHEEITEKDLEKMDAEDLAPEGDKDEEEEEKKLATA